ncbi:MAG TPA: DUF4317 domain-containing protein [Candidatus Fournierella merdavium]|nr:DUF4317 domain-containing protein [Candidatus Fournierella merdavium]
MNEKEIAEIRRRYRQGKTNIAHVVGCYVNEERQIVARFDQSLTLSGQEETDKFLALLRRTLSGTLGKNLIDITFSTSQVAGQAGDEHALLMALRDSKLQDEAAREEFYARAIETLDVEGNYLILLTCDAYDVPGFAKDGQRFEDGSEEVYTGILCSVCPVKMTKPALSYFVVENAFRNRDIDWLVAPPEMGFLFPAFDDRSTNLYGALYYTRDTTHSHTAFTDRIFAAPLPMPAAAQKETFDAILAESLGEACSCQVVQSVQEQLCSMIAEHKESGEPQPLLLDRHAAVRVLEECGVEENRVEAFGQRFEEDFGPEAALPPKNLVDTKHLELRCPDVTIQVNPERGDLVETRIIDGVRYILIRAEEGVEVNGVEVKIGE